MVSYVSSCTTVIVNQVFYVLMKKDLASCVCGTKTEQEKGLILYYSLAIMIGRNISVLKMPSIHLTSMCIYINKLLRPLSSNW